ncbi:MAG: hypothetical protein AAB209_03360 [Bacteroidota bacterium]
MSVIPKLASSLGRREEVPNQQLAEQIASMDDMKAVQELVENLANSNAQKDKNIQSDCIKVLYEIGERKPALISSYAKEFIALLDNKNNRLVWGAMTALDAITLEDPKTMYNDLTKIIDVADRGSVITKDHAVRILIKLAGIKQYADKAFALLIEQLKKCPTNQLPMYAENALPIINDKNRALFAKTLSSRLDEVEKESKRGRVEKVVKKLETR